MFIIFNDVFFHHLSVFFLQHIKIAERKLLEDETMIQVFSTELMLLSIVKGMCLFVSIIFLVATLSYVIRVFTQRIYHDKEEFFTMCTLGQNRNAVCFEFMLPYMYLSLAGCFLSGQVFGCFIADFSEIFGMQKTSLSFAYQKNFCFFLFFFCYLFVRLFFEIRKICNKI